ncbi:hypothetical protein AVEN_261713-1 [Araneus ventricosus]|uniref:Uncharacterized protein n=1 Tax=Araneus ventricosus TaxID=182803 RepID=A0A4Y2DUN7_ARAVE|nr:hypothetical protein AVEN_261713-1 [Araneus ventricosus]
MANTCYGCHLSKLEMMPIDRGTSLTSRILTVTKCRARKSVILACEEGSTENRFSSNSERSSCCTGTSLCGGALEEEFPQPIFDPELRCPSWWGCFSPMSSVVMLRKYLTQKGIENVMKDLDAENYDDTDSDYEDELENSILEDINEVDLDTSADFVENVESLFPWKDLKRKMHCHFWEKSG